MSAFSLAEYVGRAAIITAHGVEEVATDDGVRPATRADVVILGEPLTAFEDVLIFEAIPNLQLRAAPGQPLVTGIGIPGRADGRQVVQLVSVSDEAAANAEQYLARVEGASVGP